MTPIIQEVPTRLSPQALAQTMGPASGVVLLESTLSQPGQGRYSFVAGDPFLEFRSFGSRCVVSSVEGITELFGNPWHQLDRLMSQYELLDEIDLPFPIGGCFGYWGYDLKNFVEPKLKRRAVNDLELPDSVVGFYSTVFVFDHLLGKRWIVATGLGVDGRRTAERAEHEVQSWSERLSRIDQEQTEVFSRVAEFGQHRSSLTHEEFLAKVALALEYIRQGHIYQVNLSQRLSTDLPESGWTLYQKLSAVSPAAYSAYLHCGDFEIASSSPEQFLRMSGAHIQTRPIKGTRPRDPDATRDAQLMYELQTSAKEMAELVMITDLLRNDLGRVCEYGTIQVPELVRLERYAHVQHLVSTVEGRLRAGVTHFQAFASCFPGGSITGAPKIRAMEIIDELEPVSRGPYTGALGYLGFNQESQLSILIRAAVCREGQAYFHAGAGIVADSAPEAEFEETLAKAAGFLQARRISTPVRH